MDNDKLRGEGALDQAKGNIKQGVGHVTGDERTENEGRVDEVKGNIKEAAADVKDKVEDVIDDIRRR